MSGPAFTLNTATDTLLKKEFDLCRLQKKQHPIMRKYGVDAVPFQHPDINEWRENFKGVQYHHKPTNFIVTGAVDDVWVNPEGELIVVDYKSTSTEKVISLDDQWKQAYKRQMEIYQWLLRRNGFRVSDTGYFVYVNADTGQDGFNGKLVFEEQLIEYSGDDSWVEDAIAEAHLCLMRETIPQPTATCEWCQYRNESLVFFK